jgi:hypothetical protein
MLTLAGRALAGRDAALMCAAQLLAPEGPGDSKAKEVSLIGRKGRG